MSIKSDRWIRRMAEQEGMIEPFAPDQVRMEAISVYLLWHLELWLRRAVFSGIQSLHQHPLCDRGPQTLRRGQFCAC
ncbi:MAG: hypothetical protein CM15mP74_21420 [Halieaceae bacterium]|nr:MAG: hypothetical protein CM15mP74_21420 [Halieaceae bacterium]